MDAKAIEDLIAELEESIILLQGKPGNYEAVKSLQTQVETLRERLNTL